MDEIAGIVFAFEVCKDGGKDIGIGIFGEDSEASLSGISKDHEKSDGLGGGFDLPWGIHDELLDACAPSIHEVVGEAKCAL